MNDPDTLHGNASNLSARESHAPGTEMFIPLLCLIGLCLCVYLSVVHYGLLMGDLSAGDVCGGGTWGDCNSVVASRYGKLFGLPISVWGMWYYICAGTLSLAIVMLRPDDAPTFARALLKLTVAAILVDAYLAWAMWWRLERLCPLCVATYGVNVGILILAALYSRRAKLRIARHVPDALPTGVQAQSIRSLLPTLGILVRPSHPVYYREILKTFFVGLSAGGCVLVLVVSLLVSRSVVEMEKDKLAGLLEYVARVEPFDIATESRPSRGPDDADITIVVFSDFLCEQCKVGSDYLGIVAANHRESMRIVYLHYPVDPRCNESAKADMHPGACALAEAAECAFRQGRFWAFHDVVFAELGNARPEKVTEYATSCGLDMEKFSACLADPRTADAVRADISLARSVGVTVTPTSYINGRPIVGALKPWMLEAVIEIVAARPKPTAPTTSQP